MESYFKRFFVGHLLVLMIVAGSLFYYGKSLIIPIFVCVGFIEYLFYYLDAKYIPKRIAGLTYELTRIFKAQAFSEGALKFKIGKIDIFAKIEIDFKQGLQLANSETIKFHLPRDQINQLSAKPKMDWKEEKINGIQTIIFYQTSGSELNMAKENLEKMIKR